MDTFEKLLDITKDGTVELAGAFKDRVGKELFCAQTDYVCENGTLSDGHENITPAQRYKQTIQEMWVRRGSLITARAMAKRAQADYLDAKARLASATRPSEVLRAEADIEISQNSMTEQLLQAEETMRNMRVFNKVRLELQEEVRAKYHDAEGNIDLNLAEEDNWKAVAQYRAIKKNLGYPEQLTHVPLSQEAKAQLGKDLGAPELLAWLAVDKPQEIAKYLPQPSTKQITNANNQG